MPSLEKLDTERRLLQPARAINRTLPIHGVVPRPGDEPLVVQRPGGDYILAARWENDPATLEQGGFGVVMPQLVYEQVHALDAAGASWDETYVAHELPPDWRPDQPIPPIVPEPSRPVARAAAVATDLAVTLAAELARGTSRVARGAARATGELSAAIILDPVLLAGILDPSGEYVALVEIARWEW